MVKVLVLLALLDATDTQSFRPMTNAEAVFILVATVVITSAIMTILHLVCRRQDRAHGTS